MKAEFKYWQHFLKGLNIYHHLFQTTHHCMTQPVAVLLPLGFFFSLTTVSKINELITLKKKKKNYFFFITGISAYSPELL